MANSRARTAKVLYDPVDCLVVVPETGCPVIPAPFVEKTICSPLSCLCSFIKGHLIYVGIFLGSLLLHWSIFYSFANTTLPSLLYIGSLEVG